MTPADAVIFPVRANMLEAIEEALQQQPRGAKLYTDGNRIAWLPRDIEGWEQINFANKKGSAT